MIRTMQIDRLQELDMTDREPMSSFSPSVCRPARMVLGIALAMVTLAMHASATIEDKPVEFDQDRR